MQICVDAGRKTGMEWHPPDYLCGAGRADAGHAGAIRSAGVRRYFGLARSTDLGFTGAAVTGPEDARTT
jgi:hypothetical protein